MTFNDLVRVADKLMGFADAALRATGRGQQRPRSDELALPPDAPGSLEAQLAGVLVSALNEAFNRDHTRLELERAEMEAQRQRAAEALRLERLHHAAEREVAHLRATAGAAVVVWITSVVFATVRAGHFGVAGAVLLGVGWVCLLAGLVLVVAGHRRLTATVDELSGRQTGDIGASLHTAALAAAAYAVIAGLAFVTASLLVTLFHV
jgi:hypothetical protein